MKYKTKYTYKTTDVLTTVYQTLPISADSFHELAKSSERIRRLNLVERTPIPTHKRYEYLEGTLISINKLTK